MREANSLARLFIQSCSTKLPLLLNPHHRRYLSLDMHIQEDYPNEQQRRVVQEAEKLMQETMARYDPSHDVYHGIFFILHFALCCPCR